MEISREFIEEEMRHVEAAIREAQTFMIKAETSMSIYKMLLERLDKVERIDNFGGTD